MQYYFTLQYKMLNRHFKAFGLLPFFGYLWSSLLFIIGSIYLFYKTEYAAIIYVFFALVPLTLLSETKRNDFLKSCFIIKEYWQIRIAENLSTATPFVPLLVYKGEWLVLLALLLLAGLMARFPVNHQWHYTIPTPFYQKPFEFTVGFRKTFGLIFFAYFLTVMGITADNFNLGIFSLLLIFLTSFSFYGEPESSFYVWIYAHKAKRFLWEKISIGIQYAMVLALPIVLSLGYFFPSQLQFLLIALGVGFLYLLTIILAKYAAFPRAMNLPETLLVIVGVFFPPFLLFVLPFFYQRSTKKLNDILGSQL
ncbi:MAG: ABC transporter permease [Bacteroidota bacterium]